MSSNLKKAHIPRGARIAILTILLVISGFLLAYTLAQYTRERLTAFLSNDFMQYWCAARALLEKANPYDPATCTAFERIGGWQEWGPITTWNPPYTFIMMLPLAALPFNLAACVWLAINVLIVIGCGAALWRLMAPEGDRRYWLGMIAAIAYMPTMETLKYGQISLWLLLGIVGFLWSVRRKRDYLSGLFLALLLIKPHVTLLFLAGVVWWIVRERRWKVLLGGAVALTMASAVVVFISPEVFTQYLRAAANPPLYFRTATLGAWLRTVFGADLYWLQFLPSVVGLILVVIWALRQKGTWEWLHLAPGLLLASSIAAAYGWGCDQVTLLPVVVVFFVGLRYLPNAQRIVLFSLYILAQLAMLVQNQLVADLSYSYWPTLALAGLLITQQIVLHRRSLITGS